MSKKRKIVLASLLKPVTDPRMFDKMGRSLAETNKYEVNIIGFYAKNIPPYPNIRCHPLFRFPRLSLARLLAPLKYGYFLLKLKPELIIVNSHDLLIVSIAYKILFGSRVVYDIQENYQQNIIWSSDLPRPSRLALSRLVRWKEQLASRMIIHFLLAERCYVNECSFINGPFTILENKARALPEAVQKKGKEETAPNQPLRFIYSGTIAESYGIFDCIQLLERWQKAGHACQLHIIGHCPRADTRQKLQQEIADKSYITLSGGGAPVPHSSIQKALLQADFAFIAYRLNPSNQHCFPTRVWECLAYKVPMLMREELPWTPLLAAYGAGIALDFQSSTPAWPFTETTAFYQKTTIPPSFYWEWEARKLISAVESLF